MWYLHSGVQKWFIPFAGQCVCTLQVFGFCCAGLSFNKWSLLCWQAGFISFSLFHLSWRFVVAMKNDLFTNFSNLHICLQIINAFPAPEPDTGTTLHAPNYSCAVIKIIMFQEWHSYEVLALITLLSPPYNGCLADTENDDFSIRFKYPKLLYSSLSP